jgi:hypothetical protein
MVLQIKGDDQETRDMTRQAFRGADINFMKLADRVGNSK